ncbi:transcriptional repressor LexA [Candidatus Peregrinibacteria bacterium]|nr:transcriptional repressor LexA [Candidatus Peregrinibacteria bacterium]
MVAGNLLTKKQKEVLDFVQSFSKEHGYGPSLKEIQKAMKFTSHSTAQFHINKLAEKGFLKKSSGVARGIEPLKQKDVVEIPILGTVPAGGSAEALQANEPKIKEIPKSMIKKDRRRHYFLKVKGDSMIEKGILDGDLVLIREQADFDNGDIVVIADEDWKVTLKEVIKEKKHITVKPANPKYQIYTLQLGDCQIVGKKVGLIREN